MYLKLFKGSGNKLQQDLGICQSIFEIIIVFVTTMCNKMCFREKIIHYYQDNTLYQENKLLSGCQT